MKYIIFNGCMGEFPVLFPEHIEHAAIAAKCCGEDCQVVSAGYVKFVKGITCWGSSVSLGISCRPLQDADLIKRANETE